MRVTVSITTVVIESISAVLLDRRSSLCQEGRRSRPAVPGYELHTARGPQLMSLLFLDIVLDQRGFLASRGLQADVANGSCS